MISATAVELLQLIALKPIPVGKCDVRARIQLLREGYIKRETEITNTLSEKGSVEYVARRYHITATGTAFLERYTETVK